MSEVEPAERGDLGPDQVAGRVREAQGDVVHTGLLAVQDAEPVRDVPVGQRGELVGECAPRRVVLAGLPRVEAEVLKHDQPAGAHRGDGRLRGWSCRVGGQLDRPAKQLAEPGRGRRQRVPRVGLARRAAEMSADDHLGVAVQERGQSRERGPDPAVIGDAAAVERHVEIVAHQHVLACDHEVVDCLHREISFDPTQQEPAPGGIPDSGSQRDPAPARRSGPLAAEVGDLRR